MRKAPRFDGILKRGNHFGLMRNLREIFGPIAFDPRLVGRLGTFYFRHDELVVVMQYTREELFV